MGAFDEVDFKDIGSEDRIRKEPAQHRTAESFVKLPVFSMHSATTVSINSFSNRRLVTLVHH
jgi:hypothetical protein